MPDTSSSLAVLTSPAVLFFCLGAVAALARSDLKIPDAASKLLSLYLMLCIGFKGGVEARAAGLVADFGLAAAIGIGLSALTPVAAWLILTRVYKIDRPTAGALAATFGSVSVVTFTAGQQHLTALGVPSGGHMTAVLALMETPAIVTALLLLNRTARGADSGTSRAMIVREVFFGAASIMLLGSFLVGLVSGESGMSRLEVFTGPLFQGALCIFLLDLGLTAVRKLTADGKSLNGGLVSFAILFPMAGALIALVLARLAGLGAGDAALLVILAGSASYIAVPAAMRLAAPGASQGVFVTLAMAVTFPFNLLVGIPAYTWGVTRLWA